MHYLLSILLLVSSLYAGNTSLETMKKEKRIAFVIGNGDYDEAPIKNAASDAQKLKTFLEKHDFTVIYKENASKREIIKSLRAFNSNMQENGIALFYFKGHSVQVRDKNYLIPVEAAIESDHHVLYEAIELDAILNKMKKTGNRLNMVMIDAAHANPFGELYRTKKSGMAPIKGNRYMDILLSTAPNRITKPYSFITRLIPILEQKGISNKEAFKEFSHRAQQSDLQLSDQEFYFTLPDKLVDPEVLLWTKTLAANSVSSYTAFISKYPNSKYTDAAQTNLTELKRKDQEQRTAAQAVKPPKPIKAKVEEVKKTAVKKETSPVKKEENSKAQEEVEEIVPYVDPMMALIKAGTVTVVDAERGITKKITIEKDFYIGHYEVTNVEYKEYLKNVKHENLPISTWSIDFQPAVNVSWEDANGYAAWLSKLTGKKYRLPTEKEWEYAVRADAPTKYFWGDRDTSHRKDAWKVDYPDNAHDYAWIKTNAKGITHRVGTKKPNAWGLYDMLGNVSEWCSDADTKGLRALRGGAWSSSPDEITIAQRISKSPNFASRNSGFRLVQEK